LGGKKTFLIQSSVILTGDFYCRKNKNPNMLAIAGVKQDSD